MTFRIRPIVREVHPPPASRRAHYDAIADDLLHGETCGELPMPDDWPKSELLTYLCDFRGFVAHGSNTGGLETLVPARDPNRDITEFGRQDYVFASPDALWAMWFAVLDRNGTANGCEATTSAGGEMRHYWFAVDARNAAGNWPPLTDGFVYLFEANDFPHHNGLEWGSSRPVRPMASVAVGPQDFPFRDAVIGYDAARMRELLRDDRDGFPWFHDRSLYPICPARYSAP